MLIIDWALSALGFHRLEWRHLATSSRFTRNMGSLHMLCREAIVLDPIIALFRREAIVLNHIQHMMTTIAITKMHDPFCHDALQRG